MLFCHLSGMFLNYLWDSYQHRPLLGKYSIDANSIQLEIKINIVSDKVTRNHTLPEWRMPIYGPWMGCVFSINVCTAGLLVLPGGKPNIGQMHKSSCHLLFDLQLSRRVAGATNGGQTAYISCLTSTVHLNLFLGQHRDLIALLNKNYTQFASISQIFWYWNHPGRPETITPPKICTRFEAHCNDLFSTK